jgi:hypothetical protein
MLLITTGLNIIFDKPDSITYMFSAVIGDELIQAA